MNTTLQRIVYRSDYQHRPEFWYSPGTGRLICFDNNSFDIPRGKELEFFLDGIKRYLESLGMAYRNVNFFIVAGNRRREQPEREWFNTTKWRLVEFANDKMLFASYAYGGLKVHLYGTGGYFGEANNLDDIREAREILRRNLSAQFGLDHYELRVTPSATGRELIETSLPYKTSYERLPDEPARFLAKNLPAGRAETFPIQQEEIGELFEVDGRLMYGACISHLPVGRMIHDKGSEFYGGTTRNGTYAAHVPGFYLVTARVPENWQHIGLLPLMETSRTIFPNNSGIEFESWATAKEVALAIEKGWSINIRERLLWPDTDKIKDPLATWRKNMISLYQREKNKLVKAGLRNVTLHTLGSFNQWTTKVERHTPRSDFQYLPNPQVEKIIKSTSKYIDWIERIPLPENRQKWIHPEWSQYLWGDGRSRIARMALRLPYKSIVAIMTDCVYTTYLPDFLEEEDTGKPGSFRLKETTQGPISWPKNTDEMNRFLEKKNRGVL